MRKARRFIAAAVVGCIASLVSGQAYIEQGNVLDANPMLGSGGLNQPVPQYNYGLGNRIMSGNVTGGGGFRGFSPIGDPNQLFSIGTTRGTGVTSGSGLLRSGYTSGSSLPSAQISNFMRDSFNLYDFQQSGAASPHAIRPYYSSASGVTNVGSILAGQNRPGTSQFKTPYTTPYSVSRQTPVLRPLNSLTDTDGTSSGTSMGVPQYMMRSDAAPGQNTAINPSLLRSTLMSRGSFSAVSSQALARQAEEDRSLGASGVERLDLRSIGTEPGQEAGWSSTGALAQERRPGAGVASVSPGSGLSGTDSSMMPRPGSPGMGGLSQTMSRASSLAGSSDVFSMMQAQASDQSVRPSGAPVEPGSGSSMIASPLRVTKAPAPIGDVAAGGPGTAGPSPLKTGPVPPTDIPSAPIKTFVGTEESRLNAYLRDAEAAMKSGEYYTAAGKYDLARALDSRNPLPSLGRSMSLLAAGEYMTSVINLFQAIRVFESLALFDVDMKAFVPDLEVLDRRRADLERRLETREDYRLRFLLGYAEYCSGLERLGILNLEKAAAAAPADMVELRKFVETLKSRQPDLSTPIEVAPAQ